jgi:peptidyl-tRNA hydrolase
VFLALMGSRLLHRRHHNEQREQDRTGVVVRVSLKKGRGRVLMGGSHAHAPIEVRVSDGRVPHEKLKSFITMGKRVFSTCT